MKVESGTEAWAFGYDLPVPAAYRIDTAAKHARRQWQVSWREPSIVADADDPMVAIWADKLEHAMPSYTVGDWMNDERKLAGGKRPAPIARRRLADGVDELAWTSVKLDAASARAPDGVEEFTPAPRPGERKKNNLIWQTEVSDGTGILKVSWRSDGQLEPLLPAKIAAARSFRCSADASAT